LTVPTPQSKANSTRTTSEAQTSSVRGRAQNPEIRYSCHDPAVVQIVSGNAESVPVIVLDVSRCGLRLEIDGALERGLEVVITLPRAVVVLGEVRNCQRAGEAFYVGILIKDIFCGRQPGTSIHLHDDDLSLYLLNRGLTDVEILGIRDHLRQCKLCGARYLAAVEIQECLRIGAATR
jgi:hypothetical protein